MKIIRTNRPKSSYGEIERGLGEIIIVTARGGDAVHSAEIIGVLVSAGNTQIKSLQQPLTETGGHSGAREVLAGEDTGVVCPATARKRKVCPIERLIAGNQAGGKGSGRKSKVAPLG